LYISTNSGINWALASVTNVVQAAWSADGKSLVVAGSVLATSTNDGATWKFAGISNCYSVAVSADGRKLVASASAGRLYGSTNFGTTWELITPSPALSTIAGSADGSKLVAVGYHAIYSSTNSGATWVSANAPNTNWYAVASSADGHKWVAVVNGGGIWTAQSTPAPELKPTRVGNNLLLSWIVPSMDFVLQRSANLSTTNWMDVADQPILNLTNLQHQVVVPLSGGGEFFRLRSP
jgi:hypothetical protein